MQGKFDVIESFAIRQKGEFYLIGSFTEGAAKENWFLNVPLNSSLVISVRIKAIEDVEVSSEQNNYKLLVVEGDNDTLNLLLALRIGSESLDITIEGKD